ncbi:sulfotransferase domain-containing protein [Aerosakkonema funiforme]|uniref:sulfotransferase domain-containing protein n=1 Tax=Aerosakkonema funiforme TaxID=1246630 RepID=UPI0035B6E3F2
MQSLPNKIANRIKRIRQIPIEKNYQKELPENHQAEDVFLVSYPKSGNTWLRFLIANALKVHYKIEREVNFFTVHDIIPSLTFSRNLRNEGPFGRTDLPRIIKSHSGYNPYYQRVIFMVRDPRDVLISYYHYLKSFGAIPNNWTISELIRDRKFGTEAWNQHTKGWYVSNKEGQNIQLFYYEEFIKNPQANLDRLMDILGIKMTEEELQEAIKLSSKENMRKSEEAHRSTYVIKTQETRFVRKGEAAGGKSLNEEDKKYVEDATREVAQLIGYNF